MLNFKQRLNKINTFIFDVDGVLTDGKVFLLESGEVVRNMNSKDGFALQLAIKKGYTIAIITGGNSNAVKQNLEKLGIKDIFLNQHDKLTCYNNYVQNQNISDEQVLYMGDDLPDYEVMSRVGVATCPKDAATEIKQLCTYVSDKTGGNGCVRDVIEQIMRLQNTWEITGW